MDQILFAVFGLTALLSGVLSVTRKNAVAAACWLVVMFFGLAGIYVLLEAYTVAVIQILVYAGAIMVLFLFVIMLLDLRKDELLAHKGPRLKVAGVLPSLIFFGIVVYAITDAASSDTAVADRVSAVLRRAAPAPIPSTEGQPPQVLPAPAPQTISLSEAPKEGVAISNAETEAERVAVRRARRYLGTFDLEGRTHEVDVLVLAPVDVTDVLVSGGAPAWASLPLEGPGITWAPRWVRDPSRLSWSTTLAVGTGATVEVTIHRGSLSANPAGGPDGSPRAMGASMFEHWLLPFEIASLLLTGAIFGAVVLTKRKLA